MQRNNWLIGVSIISTLALGVACGDDDTASTNTSSSTAITSSSNVGAGGATGSGGSGQGGAGQGGMGQGGDGGMGQGGAGGEGGGEGGEGAGGGEGGAGQGGAGGMAPDPVINGCTKAAAEVVVGSKNLAWAFMHASCTIIKVGESVTWTGNFTFHPLAGGETPTNDVGSAISMSDQSGASATVTFNAVGTFPYFCTVHNASMQGVVYVE